MSAMHSHSGWHWERLFDGSVQITKRNLSGNTIHGLTHIVTAEAWASLVAAVSLQGETGNTYQQALEFHNKPTP